MADDGPVLHGDTIELPDGSGFFIAEVDTSVRPPGDSVFWNPFNKVAQDHRDGTIDVQATNHERWVRGLRIPWTPEMADIEVHQPPRW